MKRIALAALALLAAGTAQGDDLASTIHGSVGVALRDPSDAPPYDQLQLEYDTGTVLHLEVASHYPSNLMVRVFYAYTFYDELSGSGGLSFAQDIRQHDARFGAYFAPWRHGPLRYRAGGGYAYGHEKDSSDDSRIQSGGFLEAAALFDAGTLATLELVATAMKLDGDEDYDAEIGELRFGAAFHAGAVDFTLNTRYAAYDRESPFDEELLEFRVGVAGVWGYPEN